MPTKPAAPICRAVTPSAPSELAWILDLVTQTARYAGPALAELDGSLVPGARGLRNPLMERAQRMWGDGLPGCPELVPLAHVAGCLLDDRIEPLLGSLQAGRIRHRPRAAHRVTRGSKGDREAPGASPS